MKLDFDGRVTRDPSLTDIRNAVTAFFDGNGDYLILSRAEEDYVQTDRTQLETRAGGVHYRLSHAPSRDEARVAFENYFEHADARRAGEWTDVTESLPGESRRGRGSPLLALLVAALAAGVAWLVWRTISS